MNACVNSLFQALLSPRPCLLINYPAPQALLSGNLKLSSPQTLGLTQMREAIEKSQKHWVALHLTNTGLRMIKISIVSKYPVGFQDPKGKGVCG